MTENVQPVSQNSPEVSNREKAIKLIEGAIVKVKQEWTSGTLSEDAHGIFVPPNHPEAKCWCMLGGIFHAADVPNGDAFQKKYWGVWSEMAPVLSRVFAWERSLLLYYDENRVYDCITEWNDRVCRNQKEAVEKLEQILAELKASA